MKKRIYMSVIAGKKKDMKCPQDFKRHGHYGLQLFAEDPEGGDPEGSGNGGEGEKPEGSGGGKESKDRDKDGKGSGERTYNDAEVDRIVAKHKKEWEAQHAKDLEKAKDEARKYERMSKEQREEADRKKAEEEVAKKDARIAELEQQIATDALIKSVAADIEAMPEGITVTQDFLDLVVTGDADTSNANVKKLVGILLADRKSQEEKRATGRTPKSYGNNGGTMSEIDKRIAKYK